jgi:hypothetical protein
MLIGNANMLKFKGLSQILYFGKTIALVGFKKGEAGVLVGG